MNRHGTDTSVYAGLEAAQETIVSCFQDTITCATGPNATQANATWTNYGNSNSWP